MNTQAARKFIVRPWLLINTNQGKYIVSEYNEYSEVSVRCLHARCQCLSPVSPESHAGVDSAVSYDPGSPVLMMCGQE